MIYQMKITLKHMKPPVWRRIQVDSNFTFAKLHNIIQIAFDWYDYHLHEFMFDRSDDRRVDQESQQISIFSNQQLTIGMPHEDDFGPPPLDEREQMIGDYFEKEKDKCLYVYDFGDDWQHEILLEKILQPEKGTSYPRCIKAMRIAPEEDSRGELLSGELVLPEVDSKILTKEINDNLQGFENEKDWEEISADNEEHWFQLFDQVTRFKNLKPWNWLSSDQIIVLNIPEMDDLVYCSIMGGAGEEFGLAVYRGDNGLKSLLKTLEGPGDYFDIVLKQDALHLSLCDRGELEPEDYELIKTLGLSFRGKKQWPMLRSLIPGYFPWSLDDGEVICLTAILEQICHVAEMVKENPGQIPEFNFETLFYRYYVETKHGIDWEEGAIRPTIEKEELQAQEPALMVESEFKLKKLKKDFKKVNATIEFASFYSPEPIQENEGERPYYPHLTVAADHEHGLIFGHDLLHPEQYELRLQASFIQMVESLEIIPGDMLFEDEQTAWVLTPILDKLGIKYEIVDSLPAIDEFRREMTRF